MHPEKKKALAALIIAKAKPAPQSDDQQDGSEEQNESADEGKMEACADMIDAMKRGDAQALMHALNAYIDMRG